METRVRIPSGLPESASLKPSRNRRLLGFEVLGRADGRAAKIPDILRKKHPGEVPEFELAMA